jgi:putative N6-adenine-specific DNA methylase
LYETIYESSINKIKNDKVDIIANDIDEPTVKKAITNTKNAKVDDAVTCINKSFFDLMPNRPNGVIILNPPYGERMEVPEIEKLYKEIGSKLKKDFQNYNAWIITSSPEAINSIGLRPSRRVHIYNGSLECRFLKFELYGGSKKASKNPETMTKR